MADLAELRAIWQRAGRPGRDKFRDALERSGLNLTVKAATDFIKAQSVPQVFFAPPPASKGKVTSPELNERWQADLMDFKSRTPGHNDGNRAALIVADIFSRFVYAEPVATKTSEEVAAAFERIITRARGRSRLRIVNEIPGEVSTDGS